MTQNQPIYSIRQMSTKDTKPSGKKASKSLLNRLSTSLRQDPNTLINANTK